MAFLYLIYIFTCPLTPQKKIFFWVFIKKNINYVFNKDLKFIKNYTSILATWQKLLAEEISQDFTTHSNFSYDYFSI